MYLKSPTRPDCRYHFNMEKIAVYFNNIYHAMMKRNNIRINFVLLDNGITLLKYYEGGGENAHVNRKSFVCSYKKKNYKMLCYPIFNGKYTAEKESYKRNFYLK